MRDESPFAFAGIWDEWERNGISITSCAIVTTEANDLLVAIHDLICLSFYIPNLMTRGLIATPRLRRCETCLSHFRLSEMTSHAVSYEVNHPKIDDERILT